MTSIDELLESIFAGNRPSLYPDFEGWVRSSRRFKAFAGKYHTKISNKLKLARDEGSMQDLRAELETAALLLLEERFTLEYEKYVASKQRGPDFTVTFKTHTPFNVEVRRIRSVEWDDGDSYARTTKLMGVLCEKLGQMPPSIVNLLWLTSERQVTLADVTRAVTVLRQMADQTSSDFLGRRGFVSSADFYKQFQRLSGIVLHQPGENIVWQNPLARHPAPPEIVGAILGLGKG